MNRFFSFSDPAVKRDYLPVIALAFFLFLRTFSLANDIVPVSIDSIDYHRIVYEKVRKLVSTYKKSGINAFGELQTVCFNEDNPADFRTYKRTRLIRQNIRVVWQNCTRQSMNEQKEGKIMNVGLLVSGNINSLYYSNEIPRDIEVGQKLFFNLRLLGGLKNVGVAMEVTDIDNDKKIVKYCYLDHGLTKGTQEITLKTTPEGFTEITHYTRYKCRSWLQNNVLYDIFHGHIVKEFLQQLKDQSEKQPYVMATNE